MFGFGKTKTEKMVLKLERLMITVENAYEKGNYDVARFSAVEQNKVLHWLNIDGEWTNAEIEQYLKKRGLARIITDEKYRDEIASKLMII